MQAIQLTSIRLGPVLQGRLNCINETGRIVNRTNALPVVQNGHSNERRVCMQAALQAKRGPGARLGLCSLTPSTQVNHAALFSTGASSVINH